MRTVCTAEDNHLLKKHAELFQACDFLSQGL